MIPPPPRFPLFPYTTLFRSKDVALSLVSAVDVHCRQAGTSRDVFEMNGGRFSPDQASTVSWRRVSARQKPGRRSEEHTSELQSHSDLVCRLLLEKKKTTDNT